LDNKPHVSLIIDDAPLTWLTKEISKIHEKEKGRKLRVAMKAGVQGKYVVARPGEEDDLNAAAPAAR
jgi:hypothetical protein